MQRISSWTDLVAALGRFRYGTVQGGVAPTPLKAEWLNMVQEEIANVIVGAGIALDETKEDQLKQAIEKMVSGFLPLTGGTLTGLLKATKGVRSAKGLPTAGNNSLVGYGFGGDGDTGLYATGGTDTDGSAIVLLVDGVEAARFKSDGTLTIGGSNTPYHTGNKPSMLAVVYPVGSVYMNVTDSTNPGVIFGFGEWQALAPGRMLIGVGSGTDARNEVKAFTVGASGGEYNHALTISEIPEHVHSMPQGSVAPSGTTGPTYASGDDVTQSTIGTNVPDTGKAGGNAAHNNLPPYLAVFMWKRTA